MLGFKEKIRNLHFRHLYYYQYILYAKLKLTFLILYKVVNDKHRILQLIIFIINCWCIKNIIIKKYKNFTEITINYLR